MNGNQILAIELEARIQIEVAERLAMVKAEQAQENKMLEYNVNKILKQIMIVSGRADVSVLLQGNIDEINNMVIDFKKIQDIVTTETLIEVEINLGW